PRDDRARRLRRRSRRGGAPRRPRRRHALRPYSADPGGAGERLPRAPRARRIRRRTAGVGRVVFSAPAVIATEGRRSVYPPSFEYFAPTTLDEALSVLGRFGDE